MEHNDDWIYNDNVIVFTENINYNYIHVIIDDINYKLPETKFIKKVIIGKKFYVEFINQKVAKKYKKKYCGEWSASPELIKLQKWLESISTFYKISELKSLTVLQLTGKVPYELPDCVGELKNLQTLYLDYNNFYEIPQCVFKLEKLTGLGFSGNKISKFPLDIKFTKLEVLNLNGNNIKEVPDEICEMTNLKQIRLCENPIKEVSEKVYKMMTDGRLLLDPTVKVRRVEPQQDNEIVIPSAKEAREGTNNILWTKIIGPQIKEKIRIAIETGNCTFIVEHPQFTKICEKLINLGYTVCGNTVSW